MPVMSITVPKTSRKIAMYTFLVTESILEVLDTCLTSGYSTTLGKMKTLYSANHVLVYLPMLRKLSCGTAGHIHAK